MSEHPFVTRLAQGPLLADGAMGTELYNRGIALGQCFEAANLHQADMVQRIHLDYLAAGAELIETNSFAANRYGLAIHGLADELRAINRQAGRLARYARDMAGSLAFIAGAMGPLAHPLAPLGPITEKDSLDAFREQAEALLEGGIDLFVLETFGDLNELCLAIQAVQSISDLPIIAQATFDQDGRTPRGQDAIKVASTLLDTDIAVIGVNCSAGPQMVLEVACTMASVGARYVSAMPNAGLPTRSNGRLIYLTTPEYFAAAVPQALAGSITLIGGCCGTTPAHIAAMRKALDATGGKEVAEAPCRVAVVPRDTREKDVAEPTPFAQKLARGEFVTSVELTPPRGFRTGALLRSARELAECGRVDVVNVTDSPMARVRMDAVAACYLIQSQTGVETMLHLTTRDRSLMGLESALIGAHAMGVRNILALTGDPPSLGHFTQSTGVFDVDSIGLVRVIQEMKQGRDLVGTEMGHPGGFCVGVAVDPTKPDLDAEARRLKEKIAAGAEFVMTQPIFDLALWQRFLEVYDDEIGVPVLLGVLPLLSDRHAEFLHNEVPGITLTEAALERMRRAGAEGRNEGIRLAQETILEAREQFQGVYLIPSYNRCEMALAVLETLETVR
ncbi:MAG TPA: bifunctional homocysteine S-methyltransferase/methylenetetrahydrofolate reductase [Chloroflexi bacterium]|nr:bifunctional homocysteine S-methyltransferase/methylenetetrahydrofolate reductase [Chloroflexota bacterium]